MGQSPSDRRRLGRNAFYPGGNVEDHLPFKGSFAAHNNRDFREGWFEAKDAYEREERLKAERQEALDNDPLMSELEGCDSIEDLKGVLRQLIERTIP